ncbi:MAG: phosphosulfolactate synthase [Nitrospinae bacterium]|nr:phosphosulfolactate synthase [Nitrospinota bacterium]
MAGFAFDFVPLPAERSMEKPRTSGITMMIDKGETIEYLQGLLRMSGPFIDLGKIAVGTSRLYLEDYYREKLELFKSHEVKPFIGGQFLEFIFATQGWGGVHPYFEAAAEYGVEAIEISDNCVSLSDNERERMVRSAVDAGLEVHGEVGSKTGKQDVAELISQANICMDAGASVVLFEAAELMPGGEADRALIDSIRDRMDVRKVIFELPGWWIEGTTNNVIYELQKFLLTEFGPDVNIGNVPPWMTFNLEALRCGLSSVGPTERTFESAG